MATLTARPEQKLTIKHKRVLDAYFAERINDPQHKESTTAVETKKHTVASGDTLGKLAKKYTTTVAKIKVDNGLTTDTIVLGKVLKIATEPKKEKIGDKVTFKRMGAAKLGDEVYVIVETENLSDVEVCINVKQGKTDNPELEFESKGMFIAQEGDNDISLAKAKVGAYSNDSEITNKDDFANWAIFKITLGARHQEDIGEALDKLDDKKAFLFLVVDAHTRNKIDINYDGQNEDDETTSTNRWLDIQGKWFELKSNESILDEMKEIVDKHIPYSQSGERKADTLIGWKELDCSELVMRYLYKLGAMNELKNIYTGLMLTEKDFRKAIGSDNIKFIAGSDKDSFKPKKGDIFVWRTSSGGHTGIVYEYDETTDFVTILEAIGPGGSRDNSTNKNNGGYTVNNCTRTSVYKRKGGALNQHPGWKGYFRPINYSKNL